MIDLKDLLECDYEPTIEFMGDGVDYWDYALNLTHKGHELHEATLTANKCELEQLRDNVKRLYETLNWYLR